MDYDGPVLDNHLHIDPRNGRGLDAVRDFRRAGGTHMLIVNKPSWHHGVEAESGADFDPVFESTIETARRATDELPGRAWPVLGVHPALVSRLVDDRGMSPAEAEAIMRAGIDRAADLAADGEAVAIKSGRPHYGTTDAVWAASNAVLKHALARGAEIDGPVQLHTEATTDLTEVATWAEERGIAPERVIKHYADGELAGPTPSVMSDGERLERATERAPDHPFLMETDFVDDPDRPGAVLGPKTVPRRVRWLVESGHERAVRVAHIETPERLYGIDLTGTLDR